MIIEAHWKIVNSGFSNFPKRAWLPLKKHKPIAIRNVSTTSVCQKAPKKVTEEVNKISIVCFNSLSGIGNGKLLPAGPLREDLSELKNYDTVFINGKKNKDLIKIIKKYNKNLKIFTGKYVLKNKYNFNRKGKYLAFCGIGTPENFFDLLHENKINVKKKLIFPDHFDYKLDDLKKIYKYALNEKLQIITTEKDFMKIKKYKYQKIKYTSVDLQIEKIQNFKKFLFSKLWNI